MSAECQVAESDYERGWKDGYKQGAWAATPQPVLRALEALRWVVENDGECLGDHPNRLLAFRAIVKQVEAA
jgi:hypothetical protein